MNKFTTILVPIVFFGFFVEVQISRPNSKDGKGDNISAAIDEPRDLQAIRVAPQVDQRTCAPLILLVGMNSERWSAVFDILRHSEALARFYDFRYDFRRNTQYFEHNSLIIRT
jgi:hypothetical protein